MLEQMFPEIEMIKDPAARAQLKSAIKKAMGGDAKHLSELSKFKDIPVSFTKFVEDEELLNYKDVLYPVVMTEMEELNSGKYVEAVFTGAIGVGKALDINTPIPTPEGFVALGNIVQGDTVYGSGGRECSVTKAWDVMHDRDCYTVTFSNGAEIVADAEHLWETQTRNERCSTKRTGEYKCGVRTTLELHNTLKHTDNKHTNHSIPAARPYEGAHRELSVDPYLLGVLVGEKKTLPPTCYRWSREQRFSLLQGLMDSEGTCGKNGASIFYNTNESLIAQVYRLVTSLGYIPTKRHNPKKLNGVSYDCWEVRFTAYDDLPIFRVPRKAAYLPTKGAQVGRHTNRYITKVERVASTPVRCISVDSPNNLYLAGYDCIPTHNSTAALVTIAYQLYLLSCLVNPQDKFDLDPASEIVFIFQSVTEKVAKAVDYARFKALIDNSPYFRDKFPYNKDIESELQFPHRIYVKPVSAAATATIGQNVFGGIIDEINFFSVTDNSKKSMTGEKYDQAVEVYNSIASRRKSRFLVDGEVMGILCLVSSKHYPNDFTERKEREATTDKTIFVYSKRIWDIKPDQYTRGRFKLFTGDLTRPPRILEDDFEVPEEDDESLYDLIPTDFKKEFENDMMRSLRDVAGVATMALHPYITNSSKIYDACTIESIASQTRVDFVDTQVELSSMNLFNPSAKRWVHIDLALTGDSAGVVMGHIDSFVKVERGDTVEMLPRFVIDLTLEVAPPLGGEIQFWKIRELVYAMRDQLGVPIEWVSLDTYQSADTIQILRTKGFRAGVQSIDRTTAPYDVVKQALYDDRVKMPPHERLCTELVQLEMDMKKGKVDHPPQGSCHEDTLITDTSGVTRTIKEMAEGHSVGRRYEVLGYNEATATYQPQQVLNPRITRQAGETFAIHSKDGLVVQLTGEHKVRTERGWVRTDELSVGDDIIALHEK